MATLNLRVLIKAVAELRPVERMASAMGRLARPARAAGLAMRSVGRDLVVMSKLGVAAVAAYSAAVVAAGGFVFRYARQVANAAEEAQAAAQKTGLASASYQRLAFTARRSEVETGRLDTALKGFNLRIDAAGRGNSRAAEGFARLGIRVRDANGRIKPTEALLQEVSDKFLGMPNGARKAAIAMELFGEAGTDLIPMLNLGGDAIRKLGEEAERTGQVFSDKAAKDAERFNDAVDGLKDGVTGLGNSVMIGLMPQLTELIGKLLAFIDANRPEIIRKMTVVVDELAAAVPQLISGLLAFVKLLAAVAKVVLPVVQALGGFGAVLDMVAGIMIGRLAIAIWTAVKAVWGLNAAMYANPIGLIIAGIAALVFAGWLLYRNWDKVVAWIKKAWSGMVKFFVDLGVKMKAAFKVAIAALWQMLPPWIRMLFRGAKFMLNVVRNNLGDDPRGPAGGRTAGPRPRPPSAGAGVNGRVAVDVTLNQGRPATVTATTSNPRNIPLAMQSNRGGYWR